MHNITQMEALLWELRQNTSLRAVRDSSESIQFFQYLPRFSVRITLEHPEKRAFANPLDGTELVVSPLYSERGTVEEELAMNRCVPVSAETVAARLSAVTRRIKNAYRINVVP